MLVVVVVVVVVVVLMQFFLLLVVVVVFVVTIVRNHAITLCVVDGTLKYVTNTLVAVVLLRLFVVLRNI